MDENDFFSGSYGMADQAEILSPRLARYKDLLCDVRLSMMPEYWRSRFLCRHYNRRNVLVAVVETPGQRKALDSILASLSHSRHSITVLRMPMLEMGKFDHLNANLTSDGLDAHDWTLFIDDDIHLSNGFLDTFIYLSEAFGFSIAQPAHKRRSFASFELNRRRAGILARETAFVEMGPVTAFRKEALKVLFPFPPARWMWGLDVYWSQKATQLGWKIGVVDAALVRHIRPVAKGYSTKTAVAEGRDFLTRLGVDSNRRSILRTINVFRRVPRSNREFDAAKV